MNEKDIIKSVLNGDTEAFAQLVRLHQAKIRLICLSYLHNATEADDAAQDIFLKAYEALASYKGESSFATWIGHIASNYCLDLLRTKQRHKTDSLDTLLEMHGDQVQALLRDSSTEKVHAPQELELLGKLLGALPDEEREIVLLREVQEQSYEEIASTLQCSLDAVKGRLKRARQHLEEKCRHFLDTSADLKRP